jgi:predicted secreted protein
MKTQRLGRFAEATLELPHWVLLLAGGMVALGAATGLAGTTIEDLSAVASRAWWNGLQLDVAGGLIILFGPAIVGLAHAVRCAVRRAGYPARPSRA